MKSVDPTSSSPKALAVLTLTPGQRGLLAAQVMAKDLEASHKRWGLPLLTWRNGKIIEVKIP
ncbi:hypothetical protein OJ996_18625 [Luteolibacter sp. GHJ8]|uniref:Uncharacterized protein n=1 Tax=Luteolibacter rhizosphaerae TaxID=2989719 RepID=A0ABT3G6Y6_9BACT|nr:hypothetical protein [Luteolibacter rhizosphaerae]MCW1915607.1 hypothetical protein [Luteolibacter rhizosphaerae]